MLSTACRTRSCGDHPPPGNRGLRDSIPQASPVRILLDYRPALRHRTGVGEYAHELIKALVATRGGADEEVTLFSSSFKDRLAADVIPGTGVIDRRVPNRVLNYAWHRLGWPPVERVTGSSFDVVQTFHPLLIPSQSAAQVVTIHDLDFLDHPERARREIRRDYPQLAGEHARRADHVITNSETTARDVRERLGVLPQRISVCSPGAPAWAPREQEPANPCLLFLGTLEPRKNLGILLDAYERVRAARPDAPPLVLAGRTTEAGAGVVKRATHAPLAGHVELPGYVDDATREALVRRALILIMPSHTEGFGMPVLEAMAMGVPVVAADRGALPEITSGAARLFEPDDEHALTEILLELLASPQTRQIMRETGWRRSRVFTWQHAADGVRAAWAKAIESRRSLRA